MRILLTGASSFSGYWFVKSLIAAGHEVVATARRPLESYAGVARERLDLLTSHIRFGLSFGDAAFIDLLSERWDLLCHHGAETTDYKSSTFDVCAAVTNNSQNIVQVLEAGPRHLLLTRSIFEGSSKELAFSPYGLSKQLTTDLFRFYTKEAGVTLGTFTIPNPFGPFEEPRFTDYLVRSWSAGRVARVATPGYIRDNIHISLLARAYLLFAEQLVGSSKPLDTFPSGYRESQGAFARRFSREMEQRLSIPCPLELADQLEFNEPLERINSDPVQIDEWSEKEAWDELANYYSKGSFQCLNRL